VLTDVDGVLTDGGMYYNSKGDTMKKFHTRDGMGVTLLRKKGIHVVLVTKEKNEIICLDVWMIEFSNELLEFSWRKIGFKSKKNIVTF